MHFLTTNMCHDRATREIFQCQVKKKCEKGLLVRVRRGIRERRLFISGRGKNRFLDQGETVCFKFLGKLARTLRILRILW